MSREWARDNLIRSANERETICEKLRQIYDVLHHMPDADSKNAIIEMLIDALLMAKNMQSRLDYYKNSILFCNQDKPGNNGKNLKPINNYEEIKQYRSERVVAE
jgi:hypothetical protein